MVCNMLPISDGKFLILQSIDSINSTRWDPSSSEPIFKTKTNLSTSIRLQLGARVMFLNNSLIKQGICNGTVGIITNLDIPNDSIHVAFSIRGSIIDTTIHKQTHYFESLENCFALTIHKIQSLTLSRISIILDHNIFSPGQAYTTLSRCSTWENVDISHLDRFAFMIDQNMVQEYQRLHDVSQSNPHFPRR